MDNQEFGKEIRVISITSRSACECHYLPSEPNPIPDGVEGTPSVITREDDAGITRSGLSLAYKCPRCECIVISESFEEWGIPEVISPSDLWKSLREDVGIQ